MGDAIGKAAPIIGTALGAYFSPVGAMATLAGAATGAQVGSAVGGALAKAPPSMPSAPTPQQPVAMPTPNSQDVQNAQAKSIAAQIARRGRASTILSQNNDPGSKLGA